MSHSADFLTGGRVEHWQMLAIGSITPLAADK